MIVLVLILMVVSLIIFVFMNRQKEAIWLSGVFLSFILTNIGLMYYYSKMGGLTHSEQILFFLNIKIQRAIQTSILTLDNIVRILTVGKHLFVYFLLMFSLNLIGKPKKLWPTAMLLFLWPTANLILGDPLLYRTYSVSVQSAIIFNSNLCITTYSLISLVLIIHEYFNHNIAWVRRKLRYIIIFVINLMAYFTFFCQIDALSIFYSNYSGHRSFGFKVYQLRFSLFTWIVAILLFSFFLIVGLNSLLLYAKINMDETKEQISLEHQLSTANMGTKVFIHGIKNQLLAENILLNRMRQEIGNQPPDLQLLEKYVMDLSQLNLNMTNRMDALRKAFKYNSMVLVPHQLSDIVTLALEKSKKKLEHTDFHVEIQEDSTLLADANYLSEAVSNMIANAVDAIESSDHPNEGTITITLKKEARWCAIRIDDNGIGMSKAKLSKIFEPFYTDKNTNYSWGIGLSYVKQTTKYHFGKLHTESKEGIGSTFILAFPVYTANVKGVDT